MITLQKGEQLLGHDAIGMRDFLKYKICDSVPPKSVLGRLNIKTEKQFNAIVKLLVDNDYLEIKCDTFNGKVYKSYEATEKGRELCRAKCMSRMTREKANQLYEQILSRVAEVNNNPYYLYKITNFVLLGSFITDKETLGDIDISYDLEFKHDISIESRISANHMRASEKNCYDFIKSCDYGRYEVNTFIKNRSPKIHIIPYNHLEDMKCETKTVKL